MTYVRHHRISCERPESRKPQKFTAHRHQSNRPRKTSQAKKYRRFPKWRGESCGAVDGALSSSRSENAPTGHARCTTGIVKNMPSRRPMDRRESTHPHLLFTSLGAGLTTPDSQPTDARWSWHGHPGATSNSNALPRRVTRRSCRSGSPGDVGLDKQATQVRLRTNASVLVCQNRAGLIPSGRQR